MELSPRLGGFARGSVGKSYTCLKHDYKTLCLCKCELLPLSIPGRAETGPGNGL